MERSEIHPLPIFRARSSGNVCQEARLKGGCIHWKRIASLVGLTIPLAAARMSHDDRPCPPPESAPPVKKEDPRQRATVSFLGLLHYRLPPTTILSPYSSTKKMKKEISLSLSRREDRKFSIRYSIPLEDRSDDRFAQIPISPVDASQGRRGYAEWRGSGRGNRS